MTKDYVLSLQFFNIYVFLCRHLLTSSVRLTYICFCFCGGSKLECDKFSIPRGRRKNIMTKDYVLSLQFFNFHLFLWRHLLTSSVRLRLRIMF